MESTEELVFLLRSQPTIGIASWRAMPWLVAVYQRVPQQMVRHHFTVDVEEYFQVSAFEPQVSRSGWSAFESRVVPSTRRLLELLRNRGARATFFILGWVAERQPALVRAIAADGHEIASHGWDHRRVNEQNPAEFRRSVRRSKEVLQSLTGTQVVGFRAPNFSIQPGCEWALDILLEEGYEYDSSLFPVMRPGYGYVTSERDPHWIQRPTGRLLEIPPATLRWLGINIPAGGGAYFRIFPYRLVESALRDCERRGVPATFYIHPWEVDPKQPRLDVPLLATFRHYSGLERTLERLKRLFSQFEFGSIKECLSNGQAQQPGELVVDAAGA